MKKIAKYGRENENVIALLEQYGLNDGLKNR